MLTRTPANVTKHVVARPPGSLSWTIRSQRGRTEGILGLTQTQSLISLHPNNTEMVGLRTERPPSSSAAVQVQNERWAGRDIEVGRLVFFLFSPIHFFSFLLFHPIQKNSMVILCLCASELWAWSLVSPLSQFALPFTRPLPYPLINLPLRSLIARISSTWKKKEKRKKKHAFNYSCLFSSNTLEMELANKQCQATLILVYCKDPLMHWRSGRLLTGTCYCLSAAIATAVLTQ